MTERPAGGLIETVMRISRPILLTTTLVALSSAQAFSAPAPAPSATSAASRVPFIEGRPFAEILRKAKAEKKPIMVDVYAVWCGPCKLMDAKTFAHPAIADWASKKLVSVKIDAEKGEGRKIARRYSVGSFPTVLFLDSDGNELDRLQGAFDPDPFRAGAEKILSGQSNLTNALAQLDQNFTPEQAAPLVGALAGRNDLRRMRPLVYRILDEDPDLGNASTIEALLMLVGFEDYSDKLSAETADYLQTYLPRLRQDPRRGLLIMALAKEFARRGDLKGVRVLVSDAVATLEKQSSFLPDILAAQVLAERKAGDLNAALATAKKATEVVATVSPINNSYANRYLDLAEVFALQGKPNEAKAALVVALGRSSDSATLTRSSNVYLTIKELDEALQDAQRAVSLSNGEDAAAQAQLALCLRAKGDMAGAEVAWKKAGEWDPANAEYKKPMKSGPVAQKAAKAS